VSGGPPKVAGAAVVFLDGVYEDDAYYRAWADAAALVVAADGGARFLLSAGVLPDVVVGDFDSLPPADAARLAAAGVELARHPVHKDVTDGELAVEEALRRGAGELVLAGALGALDHTLGHLAILRRLAAPHLTVRVFVAPAETTLDAVAGTRVSVVALGDDAVLTLRGLDYSLTRGVLPTDACLGLGNTVADDGEARIVVHEGVVVVLVESGDEAFGGTSLTPGPGRR
jgi:thiamine pyrophosphokinase